MFCKFVNSHLLCFKTVRMPSRKTKRKNKQVAKITKSPNLLLFVYTLIRY